MEVVIIIALLVAIPVILFPAAFVWYINIGGLITLLKEKRAKKASQHTLSVPTKNF